MSQENNELYKDFMWQKINEYLEQGLITEAEFERLEFEELVALVEKIEKGE